MKLEVPIKVDIDDVTELIHDLQCLQTYKLGVNETTVLVSLDAVVGVFADHIRAKRLGKDIDVPSKEETIPVDYLNSRINDFRQRGSYAGRFAADLLEAIIKDYNKEVHND